MVKNLRKLRLMKGVSQKKLAEYLNISQPSINKYENKDIEPDIEVLIKLADYFDTSVDYLIGHTEYMTQPVMQVYALLENEQQLLMQFRRLNEDEKSCIENMLRLLGDK